MKRFFKIIAATALIGVLSLSNSSSAQAMGCSWYHSVKDNAGNRIGASHRIEVYSKRIYAKLEVANGVLDEVQQWHNIQSRIGDRELDLYPYCEYFNNFTGINEYLVYPTNSQEVIIYDKPDWGIRKGNTWDWSNGFAVPAN